MLRNTICGTDKASMCRMAQGILKSPVIGSQGIVMVVTLTIMIETDNHDTDYQPSMQKK